MSGAPNLWLRGGTGMGLVGTGLHSELECMGLRHPETNPSPSLPANRGKTVFQETGPWCRKGWGLLIWTHYCVPTI